METEKTKRRAQIVLKTLKKLFPRARMILNYSNNLELLVAVELSAQCTDLMVNRTTEKLFKKYRTLEDYVRAGYTTRGLPNARGRAKFEKDIHSTGFFRNKTKNILAAAKMVKQKFGGQLPRTMAEMLTIPGVARKTANVVLGNAYGIVEGIAVDTHVKRLARVLELSKNTSPEKIEQDLMKLIPKKDWFKFTYMAIDYGRKFCPARRHDHKNCPLTKVLAEH